jgi:hypothetical protein
VPDVAFTRRWHHRLAIHPFDAIELLRSGRAPEPPTSGLGGFAAEHVDECHPFWKTARSDQGACAFESFSLHATLTWSHDGGEQHTITADDGSFDSGLINPGDTFAQTFDAPGTYLCYCQIHGAPGGIGIAGVVLVD